MGQSFPFLIKQSCNAWVISKKVSRLFVKYHFFCQRRYSNATAMYSLMMTSSNGNIFRDTGHLSGEFTVTGEFRAQMPVTRGVDVFFDLRLNKRLSKQWWDWWFETPSRPLRRHSNDKKWTWVQFYCVTIM